MENKPAYNPMTNVVKLPKNGLIERKYTTKFNNYNLGNDELLEQKTDKNNEISRNYYPETPYYKFSPSYFKKKQPNQFSYIKSFSSYTPKIDINHKIITNDKIINRDIKYLKPQKHNDNNVFTNVKTLLDDEELSEQKSSDNTIKNKSKNLSTTKSLTLAFNPKNTAINNKSYQLIDKQAAVAAAAAATDNQLITIYSVGIACCRIINVNNNMIPQILLVQKKITYGFCNFVYGDYKIDNKEEIKKLLNKMTVEEKIDIMSGDFDRLWYKIWMDTKDRKKIKNNNRYYNGKRKFEELFEKENGEYLKKMVEKSHNINLIWEIPKGKKRKNEIDIIAATREFQEETNISKSMFKLYPNTTFKYEFIDNNVKYKLLYYVGIMNKFYEPSINMGSIEQLKEITDIKFMSIVDIRRIDYDGHLEKKIIPILNFIKSNN